VLVEELTWPQLASLVRKGERLCLLPIGALEQHGRHLPAVTDAAIASAICRAVSERTAVPVLPVLWLTSSQAHTTKWPGTFAIPPRLLIEVVVHLANWVHASGFTKLMMVNAHGGNDAALRVAVDEIRCLGKLQVGMVNWFELTPSIQEFVTSDGADVHANKAETALMMHLHPELIDASEISDDPDRTVGTVFRYTVAQTSRDGLTGSPSLATHSAGVRLFEEIVVALADVVEAARREAPPNLQKARTRGK
jgi:creatinine amidohydrolase